MGEVKHTGPRERPILFSGPMVRALLDGRKNQTRRVVKPPPVVADNGVYSWEAGRGAAKGFVGLAGTHWPPAAWSLQSLCPYGVPGDRLWVREAHAIVPRSAYARSEGVQQALRPDDDHDACVYREGWDRCRPGKWRPSIHMPRWASRLTLEVTDVRVARLHDISEADALAEGVREPSLPPIHMVSAEVCGEVIRESAPALFLWRMLWSGINGAESWDANPWVWAVSFKVLEGSR